MRALLLTLALFSLALPATAAPQASQGKTATRSAKAPAPASPVNLNTATEAQLTSLPGIGARAAQRILEFRQKNGSFKKIEEILETVRSCPDSLSVLTFGVLPTVSGSREKSQ